ncbi:MAG: tRNA (uridine(34)/cytosine(34)/5-carboxymethylaminomethyluridine(34)-2'-O)-methyltransferase TrmL, partial [Clostridia bacterium]|nr:tRNA (uridine(34)/cytosine(34)/5-carboxymethylaminomethyluridine(34)-2'-O)-methyltransferase TrmL [Clostridia bacterium]
FGKETKGLPEELLKEHEETCVRIPMLGGIRCLNLSNAAAVAVYEALRQGNFKGFRTEGELKRLHWEN